MWWDIGMTQLKHLIKEVCGLDKVPKKEDKEYTFGLNLVKNERRRRKNEEDRQR